MLRGLTLFKCTQCGKRFIGLDMEYAATVYTMPLKCPKCGSVRTRPSGLFDWGSDSTYRPIWESMEKRQKEK